MELSTLKKITEKGILAPSADNLQPWLFKIGDSEVDLFLDKKYTNNFCDENYLIPYLSMGAVIENMRVAAAEWRLELSASYFPARDNPLHVALLAFRETTPKNHPHFKALDERTTNRKFYNLARKIEPTTYAQLNRVVDQEKGFKLLWIKNQDVAYKKLTRLIGSADQLRFEIERLHKELIATLRFNQEEVEKTKDGLDLKTFETGWAGSLLFSSLRSWACLKSLNHIGMSRLFNFYAQLQMSSSQAVGLLVSKTNRPIDYVRGGELMERLWHEITLLKLSLQPIEALPVFIINLNLTDSRDLSDKQKKKLKELKSAFYSLFEIDDRNGLILLFRMGYAPPPSARSLRKPLREFLV